MTLHCTAVVEGGLLRPTAPVALEEGAQVELIIIQPSNGSGGKKPADILAEIASLPMEPGGQEFSGRDHNKILYGQ
jgi:predicted DNA-binding antitoxin AbrB/MazE fold protein